LAADPPPGYYASVNRNNAEDMRRTLHELIDDHTVYPLESEEEVDIWDILMLADEDVDNPNHVVDVLRNASYPKQDGPDNLLSYEHGWPRQFGFPDYDETNIPYTDGHNLFIADPAYVSKRNGWLMSGCNPLCTESPTETSNGRGGSGGDYPGDSNWSEISANRGLWLVWAGRQGDMGRAALYMNIRYAGGTYAGETQAFVGAAEPEMRLSLPPGAPVFQDRDNFKPFLDKTRSGENESTAYFATLNSIQSWHRADPVDDIERRHHETVAAFQGNRNPFIDHPEWVDCIWQDVCTPFEINAAIADAWYYPDTAGQGFLISILPSFQLMFVAMFTFEVERPPEDVTALIGEAGHRYITAYGPYEGSTATLIIEQTTGGVFGENSPAVDQATDGTMTIEFGGCDNGTVVYDIPSIGRQGEIPIQRVAKDNVALCEALESAAE
jgi:hypothetical protein